MEQETQQHEGHTSTGSLPHRRVLSKSDRSLNKKQDPPEQRIEQFLRIYDLFKPRVVSTIFVVVATCDYIHNADVFRFLILMGAAAGYISLRQAIDLLLGRSSSLPLVESQLGESTTEDEPTE